jgi:copper chaperone
VTTKTYQVSGMTCAHCVNAVDVAVRAVRGVAAVDVDLRSGRLTVTGDGFADQQIAVAVNEAGYALAGAKP